MGFWDTIFGLLRRKWIGPPAILLALLLAAVTYVLVPVRYAASSSMILVAPPSGGTLSFDRAKPVGLTNPLLQYNDSMRTVAGILILTMNNPAIQKELGIVEGGPVKLTVDDGRSNAALMGIATGGPFLHVAVEAPAGVTVQDTIARVEERIRAELLDQQRTLGAPQGTYIALNHVTTLTPKAVRSDTVLAATGVFGLSFVLALGLAYLVIHRRPAGSARRINGRVLVFSEAKKKEKALVNTETDTTQAPVANPDDKPEK